MAILIATSAPPVATAQVVSIGGVANANERRTSGSTPLRDAALWGRLDVAQLLLDAGAAPSAAGADGWSATDVARERGHTELMTLFRNHPTQ